MRIFFGATLASLSLCTLLAACGGGGSSSAPPAPAGTVPTPLTSTTPTPTPTPAATPGASLLAVSNIGFNTISPSLETFAIDADGNVAPRTVIAGPNAQLEPETPIGLDRSGRIVSVNFNGTVSTISVFAPAATGNALPERVIIDPNPNRGVLGAGIDDQENVYGFFIDAAGAGVEVYAPTANNFVQPTRVIHQSADPPMIGFNASYVGPGGDAWIAGDDANHNQVLFEFPPLANGPTAPALATVLPLAAFAVANDGTLMVQEPGGISVFPPGAVRPTGGTYALDCGAACALIGTSGPSTAILIGRTNTGGELLTYQLNSTNTILRPLHIIGGPQTGLANPQFGAVR